MIRMLDHTADVGFELEAPTLEALFDEARRALLLVLLAHPPEKEREEMRVELSAPDLETLLVRWLNEMIFIVQDEGFVPSIANVGIRESGGASSLEAAVSGVPLDVEKHGWQGEVKSATFHGLAVKSKKNGWGAQVILDV